MCAGCQDVNPGHVFPTSCQQLVSSWSSSSLLSLKPKSVMCHAFSTGRRSPSAPQVLSLSIDIDELDHLRVVLCISSLFYSFCFLYVPMKIICTWLLHNHKMLSHSSWRRPRPLSPLVHSGFLTILLCAKYCHQCRWVEVEHSEGGWLGGRMCSFWWLLSSFQLTFARFADRYERAVRKDALCFSLRNVHM